MSAQLSTKLTLDGTQHNDALRGAARELSKYKREVAATDKQLKQFKAQSQSATGAIRTFATSFKSGNVDGMLISGANAAKMFSKSLLGIAGIATTGISISSWLHDAVEEGSRLAVEAEGVRLAFERINQPGLLSNLRKETHNTVTDVELMKQAVKFNDFNLDINQLGTYLAFAQQKAKDTGQSIDYMVDSIVTGLGRKSLPILDNLGLSAAEIKEKMKEGGDMTKAVAEIIRAKMAESGDYVETAADRAKQKEVELQNALEDLGRTFQPLTASSSSFFHTIEMGAISAAKSVGELLNNFTELGRIQGNYNRMGGSDKVGRMIGNLGDGTGSKLKVYQKQIDEFDRHIKKYQDRISQNPYNQAAKEQLEAVKKMKSEYEKAAKSIFNPKTPKSDNTTNTTTKGSKSNKPEYAINSVGWLEEKIADLQNKIKLQVDSSEIKKLQDDIKNTQNQLDNLMNPIGNLPKIDLSDMPKMNLAQTPDLSKMKLPEIKVPTISEQYDRILDKISAALDAYDMGIISSKQARQYIDGFNNEIESIGLKPIKVEVETEGMKKMQEISKNAGSIFEGFSGIDNVVNNIDNLKDAFEEGANSWEIFMGALQTGMSIIQAVSSVMQAMNTIQELLGLTATETAAQTVAASQSEAAAAATNTAAKSGEAIAGATASGAKMPFPLNIVAIALGVAAVIAALGMITGAFADGGIVGGSSTSGDRLLARVNSGEMILNGRQQKNLFNAIDGNRLGGGLGGEVVFTIKGRKLQGVLHNTDDKMSKVR